MTTRFQRELATARRPQSLDQLSEQGITSAMVRSARWRRTTNGYYVPVTRNDTAPATLAKSQTSAQRILEAAPLIPADGALAGWAAAYVLGVDVLDGTDPFSGRCAPVPILLGRDVGRSAQVGVVFSRDRLPAEERTRHLGLWVTTPVRTTFDVTRWSPNLTEAVVHLDAAGAAFCLSISDVLRFAEKYAGSRGVRRVRAAVALADFRSASPWESRLRLCYCLEAGLTRPLVNWPVFDSNGKFLGKPDLLDPEAGLATEFDGQDHRQRDQHRRDNVREEKLEQAGLVVCRADSLDLTRHRRELVDRLRARHAQARRRDARQDTWTLTVPPWWRSTGRAA